MPTKPGMIVLMGSGELTATMVEVHKAILSGLGRDPCAVFLDTPAGFQLNADQISQKAADYFESRILHTLIIASLRSTGISSYDTEQAYHTLRGADYVLIGPGSPTYAVRQWRETLIPDILINRIESGGCLVAASAAALTVGRLTLPVYEIYKVGQDLYWEEGMDVLQHFGFNLVVIPHWNNAEGGTHDTRCCFMGETRFKALEQLLPDDVGILGLDEHTACLMDLNRGEARVRGIGRVTFRGRKSGNELTFESGTSFPLDLLRGGELAAPIKIDASETNGGTVAVIESPAESFWDHIHRLESMFHKGIEVNDPKDTTNALLELDRVIWQAKQDLENEEFISQGRDLMRELVVLLGTRLSETSADSEAGLTPLVEALIALREEFRLQKQWEAADALRLCLQQAHIMVEDTSDGSRWHKA